MKIINSHSGFLSNYEVLDLVSSCKKSKIASVSTIDFLLIQYLNSTIASKQSLEYLQIFKDKISPLNLLKAEELSLLNSRPSTLVELYAIIEECDERFSEEKQQEILDIISALPLKSD